jgi:hypothetical protein
VGDLETDLQRARLAVGEELDALLYHSSTTVIGALLENHALDPPRLCVLLSRKDLPAELLEEIGARKTLLKDYSVKKALAFHPRAPRLVGLRLFRDLYLLDLAQFALSPSVSQELKRYAEEQILARLPQLPLGQKITLARRGPGRVAGALVAQGHSQVLPVALNNPFLTESNVLKSLAREKVSTNVVQALVNHPKWSQSYNVRLALVRNPNTPLATVLAFLPHITVSDLRVLVEPGIIPPSLRKYLEAEVQRRMRAAKKHPTES